MKNLEKRIEIAKDFYVSGNGKKYVVDIDATLNDCLKQITELKQRLARYENPDYVVVPCNPSDKSLKYISGNLDNARHIYKAMIEAVEKGNE